MHGHTIELVTNLSLPASFDVRSVVASRNGVSPLSSIDIIDGDDYSGAECVSRLQTAQQQHPDLNQLILSELSLDPDIVKALRDLVQSKEKWDSIYIEFCQGDLSDAISAVLSLDNVRKLEMAGTSASRCIDVMSSLLTTKRALEELSLFVVLNGDGAASLSSSLPRSQVRTLRFIKSTMEESSLQPLIDYFLRDRHLQTVQFDRCSVHNNQISSLLESLVRNVSLQNLEITADLCDSPVQGAITKILAQERIRNLSLRHCIEPSTGVPFQIDWIGSALRSNSTLTFLDMSNTYLNDSCLLTLIDFLCNNYSVKEVRLYENHVSDAGAKAFGLSLPKMPGVSRVFLHRNYFQEEGASALLEGVRKNHNIVELTIPTMGRNIEMFKYQRLISFETCLNSGMKKAIRDKGFPRGLWPLLMERCGQELWTPYSEYQMKSIENWKFMQQADSIFQGLLHGAIIE